MTVSEPKSMVGRKNIYTCNVCGAHIVTVDVDEGVTPFSIGCVVPACQGAMLSSMYAVFDQNMRAAFEWYRPTAVEVLSPAVREHVANGGLLRRPVTRPSSPGDSTQTERTAT